ncbi:hypothetical protein GY03_01015 [Proteus vulgaris]|uniref:hypothetical protein n=1 Tax=Proteus vulgaris TaxID=585 RepID=UPI0021B0BCFE|nr:hypothetical protein [Proteus vulgaris]MCT6515869.1 hypothetical protein [Proteus vulgaris]
MEKLTNATYGTVGLTTFFASLSLYEWGAVIGMGVSTMSWKPLIIIVGFILVLFIMVAGGIST